MRKFEDGGDGDRRRRRQRAQKLSRRAVEDLPDDNDSSDEEENSAKNENVASSTTSHSARSAKPILPDVGGGAARRRRGRWGGAEVGMVAVTETGDNSMQFEPCHDAPLLSAARTPVVVKTAYDKLTYENMMHHNNEASPPTSAMQMLMREKEDEEKRREQQRRQQQQQRAQQQQHVFQQQQRAEAIRQQYGSQAIASHDTSGPARGVGRVAWTPTKQTTRRRTNNTSFPPSPSMTPTTKDSNNRAGGGDGDEQNQQQLHQSGSALSLASSSSALSLVSTRLEQNKDTFGPFANAVPPSQVTNSAELARAVSIPASHQRTEILGPNSVELPRSDKGKDLYGTILWNRAGKDMAPIGMMSPDGAGPGGDNRGSGGEDGGGASAVAKHVSPSSISERTCIQKFGISYHEIITKLVMEQGVLSEAESRMVLLLLSEPSDETALPETQMRMLRAVVDIEMRGISRPTIAFFRSELAAVASEVAQHTDMVRALAENDVLLAHRGSAGAPSDASASFGVGSMQPTPTAAASSPGFGSNSGHPGLLSPEGQKTLGTALEEVLRQQQQQQQSPLASEVFSPVGGLDSPASGASGESSLSPAVATLVGGAATAALASDLNALALKEREHSKAMLFPVKEELTGEQLSTAENTGNHATEVEGGGSRRGLTLQHGVDDGGEGEQQQQQQQQQQGEEGEGEEEGEEAWPQSVYEAMTMLSPKQHYQHTAMTGSPSHSAFSVASGVSRSSAATSHWDKHDTTKRMMRVPVIDRVMSKVARRISEIPRHKLLGRKQVILLGSGAYNPIHKMHLRMLYIARRYLEERTEFEVLGGLVSPSHATDVRSRYRQREWFGAWGDVWRGLLCHRFGVLFDVAKSRYLNRRIK
jgi:hypothetical protein